MKMTIAEAKEKLKVIKNALGWCNIGHFRGGYLYLNDVGDDGISYYGYAGEGVMRRWTQLVLKWEDLTDLDWDVMEKFITLKYPKDYKVTHERYLITFENIESKEKLSVNLKDKKFTKTYANGKERDIKYPHSFFKGMSGRVVAKQIPADDNFRKLVDIIINKYRLCSNMGTFLVRLFDNIHLETYVNAGIPFSSDITVPYNFFDKDVRDVLNKHNITYTRTVEAFFANNHDLGKSMLSFIKDEKDFASIFSQLARNMRDINILIENYNYDVKRLFEYCKERNWTTGRYNWNRNDLVNFIGDYARMADTVFPNGFEKYPKDIIDHHDGVSKLYEKEKIKYDDQKFVKYIDPKMEYSTKDFCIIYPKSTGDIQSEGRLLVHCVGSYVQRVINGQTTILFMRKKDEPDTPLVTVEVYDGRIHQARGKYNRGLEYDERVFLEEYAEKKHLLMPHRY